MNRRTSGLTKFQNLLMNLKLIPSGLGLFSLPHPQTATFISSSVNLPVNMSFWCWSIDWNSIPSRWGLLWSVSWNLCRKNRRASSFTLAGSSTHSPSIHSPCRELSLRLALTNKWKYWELQSPSFIHLALAFYRSKDSWYCAALHKSSWSFFLVITSWVDSCLCDVLTSKLFSSPSIFL